MAVLAFTLLPLIMASFFVPSKGSLEQLRQRLNYGGGVGDGGLNYGGNSFGNNGQGYGFNNNDYSQILNPPNQRGYGGNDLSQLLGTNVNSNIGFGNNNLYGSPSQSALASKLAMLNQPTTGIQGTGIQNPQAISGLLSLQNAQGLNGLLQGGSGSLFPNQVGGSMLNLPNMSYQGPGSQDPARLLSALNAPGINGLIPGGGGSMYQNQSGLDSLFPGGSPFSNLQGGYNSGSLAGYETLNVQNTYRGKFAEAKERAEAKKQTALTEFYKKVQTVEGDLQKELLDLTKEMSEKLAEVQHKELKERLNDQFNRSTAYLNRLT